MKSMLLITHEYPFKYGDASFVETEIFFLSKKFKKIYVLCLNGLNHKNKGTLDLPENVKVIFFQPTLKKKMKEKWQIIMSLPLFLCKPVFVKELLSLFKAGKFSKKYFKSACIFLFYALSFQKTIGQILQSDREIGVVYTFWYKHETLGALLLRNKYKNIFFVTRVHGYDLYEFQNSLGYQEYKLWMDKTIDKIFFVSQHGYDYYLNKFAQSGPHKYTIARLGIFNKFYYEIKKRSPGSAFVLCSCSYIVPVKRMHLIVEALGKIDDCKIHWIHIGTGPSEDAILSKAKELLESKQNISCDFKGFMPNAQIMQFYSENHIDCFITTSESEGGCPVSINEAISFGIPVIATEVGGIPEIVNTGFGILLSPSGRIEEIKEAIVRFCTLSEDRMLSMRQSARLFWESNFSAEIRHAEFSQKLQSLTEGRG